MSRPANPVRAITIHDVAAEAKVSKSTVSLVLQGSGLIREETARRVREAAQKLGYVYNRRAAELRNNSSRTIGVVINDLMNPFFAEVLVGLERKLVDAGYIVFMAHTSEDLRRQEQVLTTMREQNIAGFAFCPAIGTPVAVLKTIRNWGIPTVVMVRPLGSGAYDYAGSDNTLGVKLAMAHLIGRGHRQIAFLGGRRGPVFEQRLAGYRQALADAHLAFDEALVFPADPTRQGAHDCTLGMLDAHPEVTAAACYNDLVAFGALSALGERGLQAGKDFALMGFDNVLAAAHSNPPLSTVDIQPSLLGEEAAKLLLQRISAPDSAAKRYIAAPQLVLRQSD